MGVYLHVCLCMGGYNTHGGQKRAPDILELEFKTVENQHVGAENQTWLLRVSNQCS
jgi:hypothetical protein